MTWTVINSLGAMALVFCFLLLGAVVLGFWMGRQSIGKPMVEVVSSSEGGKKLVEEYPYEEALMPRVASVPTIEREK